MWENVCVWDWPTNKRKKLKWQMANFVFKDFKNRLLVKINDESKQQWKSQLYNFIDL